LGLAYTVVSFKLNSRQTDEVLNKIMGQFAFLVQRELIRLFPVSFSNRIEVSKEGATWIVGSNYEILRFYDRPTKPHIIEPKVKDALSFSWPKTPMPPSQGGKFFFKKVLHPGTKGKHIIENFEKDKRRLNQLFKRAVKNVLK